MESAFVATAVVGVNEFIKRLRAKDYDAAITIALAAVIGGVAGYFGVQGLTLVSGIVAGLAAAGIHTVARQVG